MCDLDGYSRRHHHRRLDGHRPSKRTLSQAPSWLYATQRHYMMHNTRRCVWCDCDCERDGWYWCGCGGGRGGGGCGDCGGVRVDEYVRSSDPPVRAETCHDAIHDLMFVESPV